MPEGITQSSAADLVMVAGQRLPSFTVRLSQRCRITLPSRSMGRRRYGDLQGMFVTAVIMTKDIWNRSHYLDRMTLKELWIAYFQHPAIIAYLGLAAASMAVWFAFPASVMDSVLAVGATMLAYPLVWYALHR